MEGEIIPAGPGTGCDDGELQPLDVKAADRVLFAKWSGVEIKIDDEDFRCREGERHHGRGRIDCVGRLA
jgi:co-chaperonin GroES (HSP10)